MNPVQLIDLPDELILIIMNEVKPPVLLLCSFITIGNNRLEQLAFDKCHSIDLTFNYYKSPYKLLIQRFYSHVMPRISNHIQSLTIHVRHVFDLLTFAEKHSNEILPNLIHLKIMATGECHKTGTHYTLSSNALLRRTPFYAIIPQFFLLNKTYCGQTFSNFLCSSIIRSIVSFEFDEYCILPDALHDDGLFFPELIQLTHLRITLYQLDHCVCLLNQLGSKLCSFTVSIAYAKFDKDDIISQIRSISCPNLKEFTMTIYRNISNYERRIVPLLQSLSNVEYLTLLLAIGIGGIIPNHFIDGFYLEKDIISYMPHLRQFNFHIRSILKDAVHINSDTIRHSFMELKQQSVDCTVDHFNNDYGQCQIYSLPFVGTRLDFISSRFPLFDTNNTFAMVTMLLLFDDIKPFENIFFARVSRALPRLRTLEIYNELEQQEKSKPMINIIEFVHLTTLILFECHQDYAKKFLCRTHLPCLIELAIHNDLLLPIIAQNQQQARDNCSKVEILHTVEPSDHSVDAIRNFFPLRSL